MSNTDSLKINSLENKISSLELRVTELMDLVVKKDEVITAINTSSEGVRIIGSKIMVTADTCKEEK